MSRRAFFPALIVALTLAATPAVIHAQTYIWIGSGETSSISYGDNWQDGESPYYNYETSTYGDGNTVLGFIGTANATRVNYSGSLSVLALCFDEITQGYRIQGSFNDGGNGSLYIGAGGIDYKPAGAITTKIDDSVRPTADQTWYIGGQGRLELYGPLMEPGEGDAFTLTKTGAGTLALYGPTNYDFFLSPQSTLRLNAGYLEMRTSASTALGYGTLEFNGGTLFARSGSNSYDYYGNEASLYLGNTIVSHGLISTINEVPVYLDGGNSAGIPPPIAGTENTELPAGGLILAADTTIVSQGEPLYIESDIAETGGARKLTIDATNAVILTGHNSYTGGTFVNKGVLIFGDIYSIPEINLDSSDAGKLASTANGYIGFGDSEHNTAPQGYFIDTFDKANTHGAIGFDSDPESDYVNTFYGAIDLTGFASDARLGSATKATLTGAITPQGTDYRFGGGGGTLTITAPLVDIGGNSALVAESPAQAPLTLRVATTQLMPIETEGGGGGGELGNTFSGGVYATHSAIIFAHNSLPTQIIANNWSLGAGGYIGYEGINYNADTGSTTQSERIAGFVARFNPDATTGVIGLDANPDEWGSGHISGDINLGGFSTGGIYVGTATPGSQGEGNWNPGVTITGEITAANDGADAYRFAGYKGGMLEVQSELHGTAGVVIGDPNAPETFGNFIEQEYSTVALTGDNAALTGNVIFHGGRLLVGQASGELGYDATSALGTGTLIAAPNVFPADLPVTGNDIPAAVLAPYSTYNDLIIANPVQLNTDLGIGGYGSEQMLALTGMVSGSGGLEVGQDGNIRLELHAPNTFSGGVYIRDNSTLDLYNDQASGTGMISFGSVAGDHGRLYFNTDNPVIGGLASQETAYLTFLEDYTTLTINQSSDSIFRGEFRTETESDALRIVKTGTGTLRLDDGGLYFHNGVIDDYVPPEAIPPPGAQAGTLPSPEISLEVRQGTLVLGNDFYIEDSSASIRVTGHATGNPATSYAGTLQVDDGKYIYNPVILENGGRLAGNGTFTSGISVSDGAVIAPGGTGAAAISRLHFDHLELGGLGVYEWQVRALPDSGESTNDIIDVYGEGTLVINASSEAPFAIRVISLSSGGDGGILTGLDQSHGMYVWTLFNYDYLGESGFDPNAFVIDASAFSSDAPLGGSFTIFQQDNQILLGFTPVPEPSTYALMALGLGFVIWSLRRRRV